MAPTPAQSETYSPKELELLAKVKSLEEDRLKFVEIVRGKVKKLENELVVNETVNCVEKLEKLIPCHLCIRQKLRKLFG